MAPKRLPHDPPPASSSSEEEEDQEEVEEEEEDQNQAPHEEQKSGEEDEEEEDDQVMNENEDDDGDEEEPKSPEKKSKNSDSHNESGSDTETDSDSPPSPSASDFTIKPSNPKKKKVSENPKSASISAMVTSASKRTAESDLKAKDSKKKKVAKVGDDEDSKKASGVQRLWSEDDEIAILKGMTDYQSKKGSDTYAHMAAFHEFIKENLHVDVSKNQLMDKIRRLKKKYLTNAEKIENGRDPVFAKPHEYKSFQLSKKIWGRSVNNDGVNDHSKNSKKKPSQNGKGINNSSTVLALPKPDVAQKKELVSSINNGEVKVEQGDFLSKYPCLKESLKLINSSLGSERLMSGVKEVIPLIGSSKAKELENRWEELQREEIELYVQKSELFHEQGKLILDSLKTCSKS